MKYLRQHIVIQMGHVFIVSHYKTLLHHLSSYFELSCSLLFDIYDRTLFDCN